MAEVKNAFIKSKMNKDLDDRLLPNGEYRDALNVQVSKSEASDVGALENVIGNSLIVNFSNLFAITSAVELDVVDSRFINVFKESGLKAGMFISGNGIPAGVKILSIISEDNTKISMALTESVSVTANTTLTFTLDLKCIGYFTDEFNNNIYSFFTDFTDNNTGSVEGYSNVASNFIFKTNLGGLPITTVLVRGAFLNFSTTNPIIGVNLLEELLFFTDNRNQPRKINVTNANTTEGNLTPSYYTSEDQISVAKYNPYECIKVLTPSKQSGAVVLSVNLRNSSATKVLDVFTTTGVEVGNGVIGTGVKTNTFVISIDGNNITTNKVQNLLAGANVTFVGLETSMYDVSSAKLPDGTDNPYSDPTFSGDPDFLEDKFIRFSYRFQFADGENSIFAPFTQPCFIPRQDGYFIGDDEKQAFSSTVVGFMENKVTKIELQIPLPANGSSLAGNNSPYKITAIDILYKESDGLAIQVVDTVFIDSVFSAKTGANNVYQYEYKSTKPFKTLPSKDLIRVYDKIPVKAFSQEIISNRVVYGNFQDKHTPPEALDYQVAISDKLSKENASGNKTIIEYPNSSVKQNRNYQVGIVLSDKFGRQSSTLLSNNTTSLSQGFGASTTYSPYQTAGDTPSATWPGDSLKVLFNKAISSQRNSVTGTPGLYNGDATSSDYNPLGWYSYKVVVQQKEQDYYNVYNAGAMKGSPSNQTVDLNTSYITLLNDNINKVPRDLSEVGPLQKQFRSSVRLIGRVENIAYNTIALGNAQFYPGRLTDTTSSIEDLNSIFDVQASIGTGAGQFPITNPNNKFFPFYKAESDPLIAQITTTQEFGLINQPVAPLPTFRPIENLTIFETEPDLSRLDLYFETSTSGLISELNLVVDTDIGGAVSIRNFALNQNEGMGLNVNVTQSFVPVNLLGIDINNSDITLASVIDNTGSGTNRRLEWQLVKDASATPNTYILKTSSTPSLGYQYYGSNYQQNSRNYNFTFDVIDKTDSQNPVTTSIIKTGSLSNIAPTIIKGSPQSIVGAFGTISSQTARNGSNINGGESDVGIAWSKVSSVYPNLTIGAVSGVVNNNSNTAAGSQSIDIRATDAGGLTADATLNVTFGNAPVPGSFNQYSGLISDGDARTYYFSGSDTALDLNGHVIDPTDVDVTFRNPTGVTPTTSNPTRSAYVCPGTEGGGPHFLMTKKLLRQTNVLTGNATFYVKIINKNTPLGPGDPYTGQLTSRTPASVEYRPNGAVAWTQAYDINGQLAKFGMVRSGVGSPGSGNQFEKVRVNRDGQLTTNQIPVGAKNTGYIPNGQTEFQLDVTASQYTPGGVAIGSRIFAFNLPGDYRVTLGNLSGTGLAYNDPDDPSNPCATTPRSPNTLGTAQQSIQIGDASYGGPNGSSAYEYEISTESTSSCNYNGAFTTVYAKEFITKYVSQLYTTSSMNTEKSLSGGSYVFRRIGTDSNIEGTVNGLYVASFSTSGIRIQSASNASKSCVLSV